MGLEISYYKNAEFVKDFTSYNDMEDEDLVYVSNEAFPARLGDMKPGLYKAECVDGFRAGSYGGYNHWRRELCNLIYGMTDQAFWDSPIAESTQPFVELINMADNEGTIGTSVCAKLAKDFNDHADKIKDAPLDDYWKEKAECWHTAFTEAGNNNGFVDFH